MKLLIALHYSFELWNPPSWLSDRLRHDFPQLEVVLLPNYDTLDQHIRDAEIAIAWSLRPQQITQAAKLRWIHSPATAVHQLLFPELVNSNIILTNARAVHGPVVAEHIIALILALAKQLPQAIRLQQKHVWGQETMWLGPLLSGSRRGPRQREAAGATVGLIGLGSIGREAAKKASALGMRVIAVREHPEKEKPDAVAEVYAPSQLDTLLAQSDYVVLAAPLTRTTRALIDAPRLAKMKPDACLINVSRGALIDESALVQALRENTIGGAALDVFSNEPLPADSPLWDLENLLITPHTAALTDKLWERHYMLIKENLQRYLAQQPLLAVVDKQKGY